MMNNSDAINLHKCIKHIEEEVYTDTSPKEIEFDGVLIEYKFDVLYLQVLDNLL